MLHHFLPEAAAGGNPGPCAEGGTARPVIGVPIGDLDVVRSAFVWNLAVEIARQGERADIVTPASVEPAPLWPETSRGPLGIELVTERAAKTKADTQADAILYRALERGLSFKTTMGNVLTLHPPLTIALAEMDRALDILDACIGEVERSLP